MLELAYTIGDEDMCGTFTGANATQQQHNASLLADDTACDSDEQCASGFCRIEDPPEGLCAVRPAGMEDKGEGDDCRVLNGMELIVCIVLAPLLAAAGTTMVVQNQRFLLRLCLVAAATVVVPGVLASFLGADPIVLAILCGCFGGAYGVCCMWRPLDEVQTPYQTS